MKLQERQQRESAKNFRLGDTVRIVYGPFGSFKGKIEGITKPNHSLRSKWRSSAVTSLSSSIFGPSEKVSDP